RADLTPQPPSPSTFCLPMRASKIVFERGGLGTAVQVALLPPRSKTIFLARTGKEDVEGEGGGGG
ncbi:MAG: hypothetical protein WCI05_07275, partial [Myxococcales bacterium]